VGWESLIFLGRSMCLHTHAPPFHPIKAQRLVFFLNVIEKLLPQEEHLLPAICISTQPKKPSATVLQLPQPRKDAMPSNPGPERTHANPPPCSASFGWTS
jgi:hypothetical protein